MKKIIFLFTLFAFTALPNAQEQIETGFVFVDGKYVEPPYKVIVEDFKVFINGFKVDQINYPQPDLRVLTDPGMPKGLSKEMGLAALDNVVDSSGHPIISRRLSYFYQNFPEDIANEKASEFLKTLPFLKTFKLNDIAGTIYFEDFKNKNRRLYVNRQKLAPPSLNECIEIINKTKQRYENYLKEGDCFMFNKDAEMHFSGVGAARILPILMRAFTDPLKSIKEKREALDSCGIIPRSSKRFERFIEYFQPDDKLNKRVTEHVEFIKRKYGEEILKSQNPRRTKKPRTSRG